MVVNDKPLKILLDGKRLEVDLEKSQRGWIIHFPAGDHKIYVITRDFFEIFLSLFSLGISNIIVVISALAVSIILIIFLIIQIRRFIRRKKQ